MVNFNYFPDDFGSITDLTTAETLKFDINPETMTESVSAAYARQVIPGLSHQRSQYMNTSSLGIKFALRFDGNHKGGYKRIEEAKQYLLSLVYPRASRRIDGAGAGKVLLIMPGTVKAKGFIDSVEIKHELYYRNMSLRSFSADIVFMEELDKRKTAQEVRRFRHRGGRTRTKFDFSNGPDFGTS